VTDIVSRLRQTRADMIGTNDEQHYWDCHDAAAEIELLRLAIRRLADQDATLAVCDGAVTVTMDATLTDAEREAIEAAIDRFKDWVNGFDDPDRADALRNLLERFA
jgi:hypothetical protein